MKAGQIALGVAIPLALLGVWMLGRWSSSPPAALPAPAPAAPPVAAEVIIEDAGVPNAEVSLYVARFIGDRPEECTEFAFSGPPDMVDAAVARMRANMTDTPTAGTTTMEIHQRCEVQFASFVALAGCNQAPIVRNRDGGPGFLVLAGATRFYGFERALEGTAYMRQCIETEGEWWSVPVDSHEYIRARAEHSLRELERRR